MKKLFVVLAIGTFAACNGSSSADKTVDSAATAAKDTVAAVADSAVKTIDSAATAAKDSLKAKVDTTKKK
ncbi:MAG TPA: hypothetical protein VII28_09080 [Puia sp.]